MAKDNEVRTILNYCLINTKLSSEHPLTALIASSNLFDRLLWEAFRKAHKIEDFKSSHLWHGNITFLQLTTPTDF